MSPAHGLSMSTSLSPREATWQRRPKSRCPVAWIAHCLHAPIQTVALECIPAAGVNEDVNQWVNALASAMNWKVFTVELDLQTIWPCKRLRWWALLLPDRWIQYRIPPMDSARSIPNHWRCHVRLGYLVNSRRGTIWLDLS